MATNYGLASLGRIRPEACAIGAVLVTTDDRYLLQYRDDIPDIWFPNFWGTFGGAIDDGECQERTLIRELKEELEFTPKRFTFFTQITFDFSTVGSDNKYRSYFEVPVTDREIADMTLHEGRDMRLFTADKVWQMAEITPYDHFALRLHIMRDRIVPLRAPILRTQQPASRR